MLLLFSYTAVVNFVNFQVELELTHKIDWTVGVYIFIFFSVVVIDVKNIN